jgi:hypothetical protein
VRLAFGGAAVLYGLLAIVLAAGLPAEVPVRFDAHLTADRWGTRGVLMLLICAVGAMVIGAFAALAARATRLRAPLLQLGAVTLLFLVVELALVYGGLAGAVTGDFPSAGVEAAAARVPVRLSPVTAVVLGGYLVHLLGWFAWVVLRGPRPGVGADRAPVRRGTADSAA